MASTRLTARVMARSLHANGKQGDCPPELLQAVEERISGATHDRSDGKEQTTTTVQITKLNSRLSVWGIKDKRALICRSQNNIPTHFAKRREHPSCSNPLPPTPRSQKAFSSRSTFFLSSTSRSCITASAPSPSPSVPDIDISPSPR